MRTKNQIPLRLSTEDIERIAKHTAKLGITRQEWLERTIQAALEPEAHSGANVRRERDQLLKQCENLKATLRFQLEQIIKLSAKP